MTGASGSASRAAAVRKADAALTKRAEEFARRERELRELIADYFHATGQAAQVQPRAEAKVAAVREQARREAAAFEAQARTALTRMVESGESPAAVAELLGAQPSDVRAATRADRESAAERPGPAEPV